MSSSFVCGMRNFLDQGFRSLPTILANSILLLGLLQGNLTYLFFFVGLFILAPSASLALNKGLYYFFKNSTSSNFFAPNGNAEQCQMFPVFSSSSLGGSAFVVPSYWTTIVSFFFTYLITNAAYIYTAPAQKDSSEEAIKRRKFKTGSSMFVLAAFFIIFMILRFSVSDCETTLGMLVGTVWGGGLGYLWYRALRDCGLGQFDDIFGIQTQILKD